MSTGYYAYLYLDRRGEPLYVGMTMAPERRDREHRRNSIFASEIATRLLRGPMSHDDAQRIEAEVLIALHPAFNTARTNGYRWPESETGDVDPEVLERFGRMVAAA